MATSRRCAIKRATSFAAYTWNQLAADVRTHGRRPGAKLGVKPERPRDPGLENRYEWIVLDLAIHFRSADHVAVHSTLTGPQIAYQIDHSGAKLVARVSGTEQARKAGPVADQLSADIRSSHVFADCCPNKMGKARRSQTLSKSKRDVARPKALPRGRKRAIAETKPGRPGHDPLHLGHDGRAEGRDAQPAKPDVEHVHAVLDVRLQIEPGDIAPVLAALVSHIFARTSDLLPVDGVRGGELALAQSREATIIADCQAIKPTHDQRRAVFLRQVAPRTCKTRAWPTSPARCKGLLGGRMKMCCDLAARALPTTSPTFSTRTASCMVQGYG